MQVPRRLGAEGTSDTVAFAQPAPPRWVGGELVTAVEISKILLGGGISAVEQPKILFISGAGTRVIKLY